ncbi:class I SAM-dependent methyltransferase [uncultured Jatrophihabitans sp.]|uniref:class I SAM-dependent methyltransferase n=1 Tax=uncultured Jatrophihabitans sp. TaxID=1610747 RepID=UPI0035C98C3C
MKPVFDAEDLDLSRPEVAAHYDELPLWSAPFGQLILDRVPLRAGQTVVDVGAGTGFLTVELAQRCGPTSRVIAVDPWAAAMDVLRDKCRYLGLTNVQLQVGGADAVDLGDRSVDVVVSNLGLNNVDDAAAVLSECHRVLRPGGTLLTSSNLVGHLAEFYDVFRETLTGVGRTDRLPALDAEIAHRATVGSMSRQLEQAGFDLVDTATGSFTMRYADGTALLHHYFIRLGFLPGWRAVVGPGDGGEVFAELERRLNARARAAGSLDLSVPMACVTARRPG